MNTIENAKRRRGNKNVRRWNLYRSGVVREPFEKCRCATIVLSRRRHFSPVRVQSPAYECGHVDVWWCGAGRSITGQIAAALVLSLWPTSRRREETFCHWPNSTRSTDCVVLRCRCRSNGPTCRDHNVVVYYRILCPGPPLRVSLFQCFWERPRGIEREIRPANKCATLLFPRLYIMWLDNWFFFWIDLKNDSLLLIAHFNCTGCCLEYLKPQLKGFLIWQGVGKKYVSFLLLLL